MYISLLCILRYSYVCIRHVYRAGGGGFRAIQGFFAQKGMPPPQDRSVGISLGPYGGPRTGAISFERVTPVFASAAPPRDYPPRVLNCILMQMQILEVLISTSYRCYKSWFQLRTDFLQEAKHALVLDGSASGEEGLNGRN